MESNEDFVLPGSSRRTLLAGAAWATPAVLLASALPVAAVSGPTDGLRIYWSGGLFRLLNIGLLSGGDLLSAGLGIDVPQTLTISNGTSAPITGQATLQLTIGRPTEISISTGTTYGFGVASVDGVNTAGLNSTAYQTTPFTNIPYGPPITSFACQISVNVPANTVSHIPIQWGLSGNKTSLIALSGLARYPVTGSLTVGGAANALPAEHIHVLAAGSIL